MKRLNILWLLATVVISGNLFAQGETCATAVTINNLPYNSPAVFGKHTTCGAGSDYNSNDRCGNDYMDDEEFVYKFTPDNTNNCVSLAVNASITNHAAQTSLFVTKGCPDDLNGECVAQFINTTTDNTNPKPSNINNLYLEPGETYYFIVTARNECYEFDFSVTAGTGCSPTNPTGYDCNTAESFNSSDLPYQTNGTTCGKGNYMNRGNECPSTYLDGPQYIFKFTATETVECFKIHGKRTDQTVRLSMHDTCPTFDDNNCLNRYYFYTFGERTYYTTVDSGKTYYFVASTTSSSPGCSQYDFTFSEVDNTGMTCESAVEIDSSVFVMNGLSTRCKGDDYSNGDGCSSWYLNSEDMVFKYESDGGECITVGLNNMSSTGAIFMMDGCPDDNTTNCLAQKIRTSTWSQPNFLEMDYSIDTAGTYYFIVSKSWSTFDFDFVFNSTTYDSLGMVCATAHQLPSSTNIFEPGISTTCKGNDYGDTTGCQNELITGNDYIIEYTAPIDFCGTVMGMNTAGRGGLTLMDACLDDPNANCLGSVGCETQCDSIYIDYKFEAGKTYYIIGSASNGGSFFQFDLIIKKRFDTPDGCKPCVGNDCDDCENADFELGTLKNWIGAYGRDEAPGENAGFVEGYINEPMSRHTIVTAGSYDATVGPALSTTGPLGKRYGLRLGNRRTGGEGEMISYEFEVTPENINFFYYYAVCLQDVSGHTTDDQPFFSVQMFDESGIEIQCAHYDVTTEQAANDPLFKEYNILTGGGTAYYRDWSLVAVPLDNYIGETVRVDFTVTDCGLGGHFGYAYIDAFCGQGLDIEMSTPGICNGESVTLTAPEGFAEYLWTPTGETTRSIEVSAGGTYSVTLTPFATNPLLNCNTTISVTVEEATLPTADFNIDEGCQDSLLTFISTSFSDPAYPLEQYDWSFSSGGSDTGDVVTHGFPGPGTYDIELVVTNSGGCKDSITQPFTINPYPTLPPFNTKDSIETCVFDSVFFTSDLNPNAIFEWTGPEGLVKTDQNFGLYVERVSQAGWYILYGESIADSCVYAFDSTYLHVDAIPEVFIKPDTTICYHDSIFPMYSGGGLTYAWEPAHYFDDPISPEPTITIGYTDSVTVTIGHRLCPDTTIKSVITVNRPIAPLSIPDSLFTCEGDSIRFEAMAMPDSFIHWISPFDTVQWKNFTIDTARTEDEGYYKAIAYLGDSLYCPFDSGQTYLTVYPQPDIAISMSDNDLCPGDSTILTASGGIEYQWIIDGDSLFGFNGNEITRGLNEPTEFMVTGSDENGCVNGDTVMINVFPDFVPDLGPDQRRCLGEQVDINLNVNDFYKAPDKVLWSTGETTNRITVNQEGDYWVMVDINGCVKFDTINVSYQDPAAFTLGNDTLLCDDSQMVLDLRSYNGTFTWNDGDNSNYKVVPPPGGTFYVDIVSGLCVLTDTINIDFQTKHQVVLPADTNICDGMAVTYNGLPNGINKFSVNGIPVQGNSVTINQVGTHQIELVNTQGVCTESDQTQAVVIAPPAGPLDDDVTICEDATTVLDATIQGASSYLWDTGETTPTITTGAKGDHSVTIEWGPCTVTDQITVLHDLIPQPDLGLDETICEDKTFTLTNNVSDADAVLWSTGETTQSIVVSQAGTYDLTVTRGLCTNSDQFILSVDTIPHFELGDDFALCPNEDSLLTTGLDPSGAHQWSTGETTPSVLADLERNYAVTVTNGKCSYTDDIDLRFISLPQPDLGADQNLCNGDVLTLSPAVSGYDSIVWSTGDRGNATLDVTTSGTYDVTTYYEQCGISDQMNATFFVVPAFDLGSDTALCQGEPITIGTALPYAHQWDNGSTASTLSPTQSGTYTLTVTNGPCSTTDAIDIEFQVPPNFDLGPDILKCDGESATLQAPEGYDVYLWNGVQGGPTRVINVTNTYVLQVIDDVCTYTDQVFAEFTIPTPPNLTGYTKLCLGDQKLLDATTPNATYMWNTGHTTPSITTDSAGLYVVNIEQGGCEYPRQAVIETVEAPVFDIGPDTTVCADVTILATTGLSNDFIHQWNTESGETSMWIKEPGTYWVEVVNGPCRITDSITVKHYPLPELPKDPIFGCPDTYVPIDLSSEGVDFKWNHGPTTPQILGFTDSTYHVTITNEYHCVSTLSVTVNTDPDCPEIFHIPNTFSPNGDGVNEKFFVSVFEQEGVENVTITDFYVYNRWGEQLFHSSDGSAEWDGKVKGKLVPLGTYLWRVDYVDQYDRKHTRHGNLNVIR